uniref:A-kinase anchor protein 17A n=1 Tax=Panagrellus redivivus TaxID=6233 RepID=A0A7E4UQ40_PANRE
MSYRDDIPMLDCGEEAEPFYLKRGVHIVPIYALTLIVEIPIRAPGQTFCNWDIREKLKTFVHPHELKDLKVIESCNEYIKFTTHVLNIDIMDEVITLLDNRTFRAPGFESVLKVLVRVGGYPCPKVEDWQKHFRGKRLKEDEPGERPDTVYVAGLPYEWFAPNIGDDVTSVMLEVMSAFGKVRQIDIPQEDPYRSDMEKDIAGLRLTWFNGSFSPFFEMYVQYTDYDGFFAAMTKLGGHQLVRRTASGVLSEYQYTLEFDKTGHLSNRIMIQRELARQCIIHRRRKEAEEKAQKDAEAVVELKKVNKERNNIENKIKVVIEQAGRQRECAEELLRKKLKDKKRHQANVRIQESENLLKFLLVDEVVRIEWEKEQRKRPADKIKEYVKAKQLPGEDDLRQKLMKKREAEIRAEVAKRKFNPNPSSKSDENDQLPIADNIKSDLTAPTPYDAHQRRKQMLRDCRSRRRKLLKEVGARLQRYRTKFKEEPIFDRLKLAPPEALKKSININIKTTNLSVNGVESQSNNAS